MTPQCQRLLTALRRRPMTSLEILDQVGIARAAARVYDLKADLASQNQTIATELITVENRYGEVCRIARYAVIPLGPQVDLFEQGRAG